MRRIGKKVREEAALLCAQMASFRAASDAYQNVKGSVAPYRYFSKPSSNLAWLTFDVVVNVVGMAPLPECWAEAEALLRCGWSPE